MPLSAGDRLGPYEITGKLGAVLYEMLTGNTPFPGDDVSQTLARVIEREPDLAALPPRVPSAVRRLLRRCLEKDRKRRLRDIGDALAEVEEASDPTSEEAVATGIALPEPSSAAAMSTASTSGGVTARA